MPRPASAFQFAWKHAALAIAAGTMAHGVAMGEAGGLRAPGKPVIAVKARAAAESMRHPAFPRHLETEFRLSAPSAVGNSRPPDATDEKRLRIGVPRDVASEIDRVEGPGALRWVAAPGGGQVARLSVTSPHAQSLRVGLSARRLPQGAVLRVEGAAGLGQAVGKVDGAQVADAVRARGIFWTPLTEGETQTIEVWLPDGMDASGVAVAATSVSHLDRSPRMGFKSSGPGVSEPCNQDAICVTRSNEALAKAARSVAKMVFTENGSTYLCSATLVSDGVDASQVPYLHTAAHCIDSQAAASSINTFWFFEAAACGGEATASYRQLSHGATLLYSNPTTDVALLRLNEGAPEGAWFSGWDADPVSRSVSLVAIHHPGGDLKKISLGQSLDPTPLVLSSFTTAAWLTGSTEGGSSGSGLFTLAGDEYLLRGGLRGGSASCSSSGRIEDPSNRDYYSRLDLEVQSLRTWLLPAAAPAADYTGVWWNPAEPGWGLTIIQDASNRVFATWYLYDAESRPTWLVLSGGAWRSATALEGNVYRASGSSFYPSYDPSRLSIAAVGSARIDFAADGSATLAASIDGLAVVKSVRRQSP